MSTYHLPTNTERSPRAKEAKPDGFVLGRPEGGWDAATLALLGFVQVVEVARPADTGTHTYVSGVSRVGDVVTRTWTQRPWTAEELAARAAEANRTTLGTRVQGHITALQSIKGSSGTLTALQLSNAVRALAAAQLDTMRYLHNQTSTVD